MKRFSCTACGKCCRDIRLEGHEKKGYPHIEGNIIHLNAPFIRIFEWQFQKIADAAREKSIEFNPVPCDVVFDLKRNVAAALSFTVSRQPCVFLDKHDHCRIYENRPLICRVFPAPLFFHDMILKNKCDVNWSNECPGAPTYEEAGGFLTGSKGLMELEKNEIIARLYHIFDKGLAHGAQFEEVSYMEMHGIKLLAKEGLIKPVKEGYPLKYMAKRIGKARQITLSELYGLAGRSQERQDMVKVFEAGFDKFSTLFEKHYQDFSFS